MFHKITYQQILHISQEKMSEELPLRTQLQVNILIYLFTSLSDKTTFLKTKCICVQTSLLVPFQ